MQNDTKYTEFIMLDGNSVCIVYIQYLNKDMSLRKTLYTWNHIEIYSFPFSNNIMSGIVAFKVTA